MRPRCYKTLVIFTENIINIRAYDNKDFKQIVKIYKTAFAEPPWNEKWSTKEIAKELEYSLQQKNNINLIAEINKKIVGFVWGYDLPIDRFSFLKSVVDNSSNYLSEIAVNNNTRIRGIGTRLVQEYFQICKEKNLNEIVLRTDERNTASMNLFNKTGYIPLNNDGFSVYDPKYPNRIYFSKKVK
ncbi:MAG: GNAT family N-acetyltransferase [Candidatus Woesearchaeota archaeon]